MGGIHHRAYIGYERWDVDALRRKSSKITIKDVASHANVSLGTVSRVLNGNATVNRDIAHRVSAAIVDLGFTPNAAARSMRSNTTRTVAFIVSDISNPLYARIVKSAEQVLNEKGYFVLVGSTGHSHERELKLISLLRTGRVDASLLAISDESDPAIVEAIGESEVPIVLLDREMALPLDSVLSDHRSGMRKAVAHLWQLNHRRIALIAGGEKERPGRERLAGFLEGHRALGAEADPKLTRSGNMSEEFGFQETYDLLMQAEPPTAIIAGSNRLLAGAIRAIRQLKVRIPDDISLIGCDDTDLSNLLDPPVTVISRDMDAIGRAAGLTLLRRLSDPSGLAPTKVLLPTDFIVRESCVDLGAPRQA